MDSFEFTKIAGAVLSALLLIFGTKTAIEMNVGPHGSTAPGYTLPAPEPEVAAAGDAAAESGTGAAAETPFATLLASANVESGKTLFSKCKGCHNVDKGGAKSVGPALWGVVGRKRAANADYNYSEGMKAKGGEWTFDELSAFLTNPKANVPGTKMVFSGLANPADRANLIAYLNGQSDAPLPPPEAPAAPAPEPAPAAAAPASPQADATQPAAPAKSGPAPAPAAPATPPSTAAPAPGDPAK